MNRGNSVTPPDRRPHALRANAARQAIAERFLAAAHEIENSAPDEPLAFPAYMQLTSIRITGDGSLNLTLNIPGDYVNETFLPLTSYTGQPLTVSLEVINITDIDPLA